jgi:hypothetical protein
MTVEITTVSQFVSNQDYQKCFELHSLWFVSFKDRKAGLNIKTVLRGNSSPIDTLMNSLNREESAPAKELKIKEELNSYGHQWKRQNWIDKNITP